MGEALKILYLFKKPKQTLKQSEVLLLGMFRILTYTLTLFIAGVLVSLAFTHIPVLTAYAAYVTYPGMTGFFSSAFYSGFIALIWAVLACVIAFCCVGLLYVICMLFGGGFSDE